MGGDQRRRRRRRGGGRRAARGPRHQQLRALPRRRHPVRVAARAARPRHGHARAAAALAPRLQGALDILVRGGAGPQWSRRS